MDQSTVGTRRTLPPRLSTGPPLLVGTAHPICRAFEFPNRGLARRRSPHYADDMSHQAGPVQSNRAQQGKAAPKLHCFAVRTALIFLAFALAAAAEGPGEAAAHSRPETAASKAADFKVVVWYRKDDSLATFKYEIYDLRKGEYTPKVDEWIKNVQAKFPAYYVTVRNVDLKREKGETERLKVGSVVKRELFAAAALDGIVIGPGRIDSRPVGSGVFGGAPGAVSNQDSRLSRSPSASGVDRSYLNPTTSPYPVPVPILNRPR
jgi:hypothetical protein